MNEEKKFEKGDELWVVRDRYGDQPLREPKVLHGRIVGGGSSMTIIQWDHLRSVERVSAHHANRVYSRTREDAIERSVRRMEGTIRLLQENIVAARAALVVLADLAIAEPVR